MDDQTAAAWRVTQDAVVATLRKAAMDKGIRLSDDPFQHQIDAADVDAKIAVNRPMRYGSGGATIVVKSLSRFFSARTFKYAESGVDEAKTKKVIDAFSEMITLLLEQKQRRVDSDAGVLALQRKIVAACKKAGRKASLHSDGYGENNLSVSTRGDVHHDVSVGSEGFKLAKIKIDRTIRVSPESLPDVLVRIEKFLMDMDEVEQDEAKFFTDE